VGTYYALVNITKRQRYEPANGAVKHGNFIWYAEEIVNLLLGDWRNDDVVMCSDGSDEGPYWDSYGDPEGDDGPPTPTWPAPAYPLYEGGKLALDRNGMTKMMKQFVEALGPDAVRVALDEALEKAGMETE
jgi:hypothetical protein